MGDPVPHREIEWRPRTEDIERALIISDQLGIGRMASRILVARGIRRSDEVYAMLHPTLRNLHDPFLLAGMEEAVKRVRSSLEKGKKILIHGDYDADGITSTALMIKALSSAFGKDRVLHHLPSRYGEGYGLSEKRIREAGREGVDLMITVDSGIRDIDAVRVASETGIDVIITDHHEPGSEVPDAFAIIDPKMPSSGYPFRELAGVGVAFKMVQALQAADVIPLDARSLLDLVALGTVADLVPLLDENRILVSSGLEELARTSSPGIISLMRESGMDAVRPPTATDIAYKLAPRLNSAGRMGSPDMALDLLLTDDRVDADLFARELNTLNFKRRAVGQKLVEEIEAEIVAAGRSDDPIILVWKEGWNPGVLGVSASRVMEDHGRPVAVLSVEGEVVRGSARAPEGFNMVSALESCSDLLSEYGGHERAAGLTLNVSDMEALRSRLISYTLETYPSLEFRPYLDIDLDLELSDLTIEELEDLERLRPFGSGNPEPVVSVRDVAVGGRVMTVGDGRHLKFTVDDGAAEVPCIFFNMGDLEGKLTTGMSLSVAGVPYVHRWGGRSNVEIRVRDIKSPEIQGRT